ncbi:hypothetical protein [Hydrogenophaga sp.]|uniref:hypothetical protein n=1 Tax=Hydrogenophaga sp. TaxID=1904254 RepID=UPI00273023C0|nr:hypothetical protein [Hydrogenophaga sp.]MDP2018967.1 hypothetical protein [Hydrogenophaga sp.]MDP3164345.1 hypothetical protein [Hydrogenophaga sp.]
MVYRVVSLEYKHKIYLDDSEPSFYVKDLEGYVLSYNGYRRERVGRFRIFVIDVEMAFSDRFSVFEVFDYRSETIGYWSLYEPSLEFKTKVVKVLPEGDRWQPNILILDRMEIFPKYRGEGIGLNALRCLQRQFSTGCGIIAMKPFPLQFEGGTPEENADSPTFVKLGLGTFDRNEKRAMAKLRAYYARLGFVRVPGTEYMVADPLLAMPSLRPE